MAAARAPSEQSVVPAVVRRGVLPKLPSWRVARQGVRWLAYGSLFAVGVLLDRAKGKRAVGARLRTFFERVGGTAVKIGQQMSLRADLLPDDICTELSSLTDNVPPIPEAAALALLEMAWGHPVSEVVAELLLPAIGSGSVACVYRARLKTGELVAVKLLRPDVTERFAADMAVMDLAFWILESLALVRADLFNHLRTDLRTMLGERDKPHPRISLSAALSPRAREGPAPLGQSSSRLRRALERHGPRHRARRGYPRR